MKSAVVLAITLLVTVGCDDKKHKPAPAPPGSRLVTPQRAGERLVLRHGCLSCHNETQPQAPPFKGLWARCEEGATTFEDGTVLRDLLGPGKEFPTIDAYVRAKTLGTTPRVIRGTAMPKPRFDTVLSPQNLDDIVAYLKTL